MKTTTALRRRTASESTTYLASAPLTPRARRRRWTRGRPPATAPSGPKHHGATIMATDSSPLETLGTCGHRTTSWRRADHRRPRKAGSYPLNPMPRRVSGKANALDLVSLTLTMRRTSEFHVYIDIADGGYAAVPKTANFPSSFCIATLNAHTSPPVHLQITRIQPSNAKSPSG